MKKIPTLILVIYLACSFSTTAYSSSFKDFLIKGLNHLGNANWQLPRLELPILFHGQLVQQIKKHEQEGSYKKIFETMTKQTVVPRNKWINFLEENTNLDFLRQPELSTSLMQYLNISILRNIFYHRPNLYKFYFKQRRAKEDFKGSLALLSEVYSKKLPVNDNPESTEEELDKYIISKSRQSRKQYSEHIPSDFETLL